MRYIKLFEHYYEKFVFDERKVISDLDDMFVELIDNDFSIKKYVFHESVELVFKKSGFNYTEVEEYIIMSIDYLNELYGSSIVNYFFERRNQYGHYIHIPCKPEIGEYLFSIKVIITRK